jgi:hypothetical protein
MMVSSATLILDRQNSHTRSLISLQPTCSFWTGIIIKKHHRIVVDQQLSESGIARVAARVLEDASRDGGLTPHRVHPELR